MLKLLAEIDEFMLEETKFLCEFSNNIYMLYSYKQNNNHYIQINVYLLENNNLDIKLKINNEYHCFDEEFENIEQFKKFFCKSFKSYLH